MEGEDELPYMIPVAWLMPPLAALRLERQLRLWILASSYNFFVSVVQSSLHYKTLPEAPTLL